MTVSSSNGASGSKDPQKLARIAGWFFIATIVTSIPASLLYAPLLHHHNYIVSSGTDTRIALGAFLEILLVIANIATAVVLFPVIRRHSQSMSLGYVASRTLESTVIVIGIVSVLAVVKLRQDLAATSAANASLILAGRQLVAVHNWTFLLGPSFCAAFGNGILLGTVMYRSGLVPRRLAVLGVVGGPLAFIAATGALFNVYAQNSAAQSALTIPEILWEVSLGVYLIVKGFRSEALQQVGAGSTEALERSAPIPVVAAPVA